MTDSPRHQFALLSAPPHKCGGQGAYPPAYQNPPSNSNLCIRYFLHYHTRFLPARQEKRNREQHLPGHFPWPVSCFHGSLLWRTELLLPEGLAVGALIHGGVCLVGTYQDMLQRAVVFVVTVVCALGNGTLDASVCMAAHTWFLLCIEFGFSLTRKQESILEIKPIYTWWKGKQNPFLYDLFLTDFLWGN